VTKSVETYEQLQKANYLDLSMIAESKAANEFCADIITKIEAHEARQRKRREDDKVSFHRTVTRLLSDLVGNFEPDEDNWRYIPLGRSNFSKSEVGYTTFVHVLKMLEKLNLIEVVKGGNKSNLFKSEGKWAPGLATRLRTTEHLLLIAKGHGITKATIRSHFSKKPSLRELRLRSSSKRNNQIKINGRNMTFIRDDTTSEIVNVLYKINKYLVDQEYTGMQFYGLRRIFNEGDHPEFNWNMGGRLYAVERDNYQMLKKLDRSKITINGTSVVEIDINASYLRILHSLREMALPNGDDIYHIEGIDRRIVKAWISATLGHTRFHTRWPSKAIEELMKSGIKLSKRLSYPSLKPLLLDKFPVLADWPTCGIRWSHLMYHESEAMIETMLTLQDMDIVSLPVHDSLIVTEDAASTAKDVMQSVLETRFGVPFVISGH